MDRLLREGIPWCLTYNDKTVWAQAYDNGSHTYELVVPLGDDWQSDDDFWEVGDEIKSEVSHDTGLYSFTLAIDSLVVGQSQTTLVTHLSEDIDHLQRRQSFRVSLLLDAKIMAGHALDERYEALLRDMSQIGARLSVASKAEAPPVKSQIKLLFDSAQLGKMNVKCQIRWIKPIVNGYEMGLHFLHMDKVETEKLHKYLWETQLKRLER